MGYDFEDCLFCYLQHLHNSPKNSIGFLCLECMSNIQHDLNNRMKDSLRFSPCADECSWCLKEVPIGFNITLCSKECIENYK